MSDKNYTLEIISHHEKFARKTLRKYNVEGIETVGAWGDEPFEIRFKNNTYQKVQVKLSIDGTDILTGKPANTEINKDMWVVNGYSTLSVKAWPETNNGGASFVFTSATNSVALHTHGDMSNRGIIAAAVFEEGYVEPKNLRRSRSFGFDDVTKGGSWVGNDGRLGSGPISYTSNSIDAKSIKINTLDLDRHRDVEIGESQEYNASASLDFEPIRSESAPPAGPASSKQKKSLESLVSVGAGQHVNQKITYVTGLKEPIFADTVRVKYVWWDDLVAKLKEQPHADPHPSGFPGDRNEKHINLSNVPKVQEKRAAAPRIQEQVFYILKETIK